MRALFDLVNCKCWDGLRKVALTNSFLVLNLDQIFVNFARSGSWTIAASFIFEQVVILILDSNAANVTMIQNFSSI